MALLWVVVVLVALVRPVARLVLVVLVVLAARFMGVVLLLIILGLSRVILVAK